MSLKQIYSAHSTEPNMNLRGATKQTFSEDLTVVTQTTLRRHAASHEYRSLTDAI